MTKISELFKDKLKEVRIRWVSYRFRKALKRNDTRSAESLWLNLCSLINSRSDEQIKRMEARHG